ncbi:MAG: hypothetical protein ACOZIN_12110 [Myxococcota bacterium]
MSTQRAATQVAHSRRRLIHTEQDPTALRLDAQKEEPLLPPPDVREEQSTIKEAIIRWLNEQL